MTRRSKSWMQKNIKIAVDNPVAKGVDLSRGSSGADKALADNSSMEGIKIDADVWGEFITVGKLLCLRMEDPDLYDLFDWMRINIFSGQPYGDGLLARVDAEILKELGPWTTN